jgi:hypothetical protein
MTDTHGLVKDLRDVPLVLCHKAADRIEVLEAMLDKICGAAYRGEPVPFDDALKLLSPLADRP